MSHLHTAIMNHREAAEGAAMQKKKKAPAGCSGCLMYRRVAIQRVPPHRESQPGQRKQIKSHQLLLYSLRDRQEFCYRTFTFGGGRLCGGASGSTAYSKGAQPTRSESKGPAQHADGGRIRGRGNDPSSHLVRL